MNTQALGKVLLGACLLLASPLVFAIAGITSDEASPHFATNINREDLQDMQVKVLGGDVRITRRWTGKGWEWNSRWADLGYEPDVSIVEAKIEAAASSGTVIEGDGASSGAITSTTPFFIFRNGQAYRRVAQEDGLVYENQLRYTITKTASGYLWRDRKGNSIAYDDNGRMQYYANANGVTVSLLRDSNGYITEIKDHHGNSVITYQWENVPNAETVKNVAGGDYIPQRLVSLTDYAGRQVVYHWNDTNQLVKVTDVLGADWLYAYEGQTCENSEATGCAGKGDDQGKLISQTDPDGYVTRYAIDKNGVVSSRIDAGGSGTSYDYSYDKDKEQYYLSARDQSGTVTESWYNSHGVEVRREVNGELQFTAQVILSDNSVGTENLIERYGRIGSSGGSGGSSRLSGDDLLAEPIYVKSKIVTDARGNKTTYDYDQWKNLVKQTNPDTSEITYTWNLQYSLPLTIKDEKGVVTELEYDDKGNLLTLIEAKGTPVQRTTRYTYDEFGQVKTVTTGESTAGNTELATAQYEYDQYGNITRMIDPLGNITDFKDYDALGNAHTIIDARANQLAAEQQYTWHRSYDAAGNLLASYNPYGTGQDYTYTPGGRLHSITAANGSVTKLTSNNRGLPLTITDANAQATKIEYDKANRPTAIIDANGHSSRLTYDAEGRLSAYIDGEGNSTQYLYSHNLLSGIQYPTYKEVLEYDSRNRINQVKQQANSREYLRKLGYDVTGNLASRIDANGNSEAYEYDALNRLVTITDAIGGKTHFAYDARDNLIRVEDPEGRLTVYTYTKNDQQRSETKHDYIGTDRQRVYEYDANGNLIAVTNPEQEKTTFEYDRANRLVKTAVYANKGDSHPVKVVNYHVNEKNQLTGYSQQTGMDAEGNLHPKATPDILPLSETYTYTNLNQIESVTVDFGSFQKSYSYTYYPNGLKKTYTNPEGITYTYYYNKNNQIAAVHIPGSGQLSYTNFQWLVPQTLVLPGGSKITLNYTDFLQVKKRVLEDPAANDIAQALYEYDLERNITNIATEHGNYLFGYDNLYRLTSADYPSSAANDESFQYDGVGNRTLHTVGEQDSGNTTTATHNNQNQQLNQGNNTTFTYNANGHTATKTTDGVITEYIYNHEERLIEIKEAGVTVGQYAYNPYGQRIRKIASGQTTYFLYNDEGLAAEYDSSGTLIKEYHFKSYSPWMTEPLFQRTADGEVFYYQNDHLGTPQRMVAANGAVVWEARYAAFGEAEILVEQEGNNLRFPGQYFDGETRLHHNLLRDYDPRLGRYLQRDPIGLLGGVHAYLYVYGNPVLYFDPFGLWAWGDPLPQGLVDFSAGFGDTLSFGITDQIRDAMGTNGSVDKCSGAYGAGEWAGIGVGVVAGGAAGWRAAGSKAVGKEFSHWIPARAKNWTGFGNSFGKWLLKRGNKWNGNYVSSVRHYRHDPFRYPRGWRDLGPRFPRALQQFDRVPNVYKGAAAGGAVTGSQKGGNNCECI